MFRELERRSYVYRLTKTYIFKAELGLSAGLLGACILGLEGFCSNTRNIVPINTWYDPATGLYKTTGWWNSANSITVLADYARLTKSAEFNPVFANTFTAGQTTVEDRKPRRISQQVSG